MGGSLPRNRGNTMSKYSSYFSTDCVNRAGVTTRKRGNALNCIPAYDITHVDADGHITILNPAPKKLDPWHPNFDPKDK